MKNHFLSKVLEKHIFGMVFSYFEKKLCIAQMATAKLM